VATYLAELNIPFVYCELNCKSSLFVAQNNLESARRSPGGLVIVSFNRTLRGKLREIEI